MTAAEMIERLGLEPLPGEGGYFRRYFEHPATLPENEGRRLSSAIYFLITKAQFSALHRLREAVEVFHFLDGDAAQMLQIDPDSGEATVLHLGTDRLGGQSVAVVPAGHWQGLRLAEGGTLGWALFSVTVSPEYLQSDFELAERESLRALCPEQAEEIRRLTRP